MRDSTPYMRTPEAAAYCGLSARTLEKFRLIGEGPTFIRPSGRRFISYARDDLDAWMRAGRRFSTDGRDMTGRA